MPRFGAHAFLWIDEWTTEKGNHAIRQAAESGFDFLEIPLLKPQEFDAKAHKKALRAAGLGATASLVLPLCRAERSRPPRWSWEFRRARFIAR